MLWQQIDEHFGVLLDEHGFSLEDLSPDTDVQGGKQLLAVSETMQIKFQSDRGQVLLAARPSHHSAEWFDMMNLAAYVSEDPGENLSYRLPNGPFTTQYYDEELSRLSGILRDNLSAFEKLFAGENFPDQEQALNDFIARRTKARIENLGRRFTGYEEDDI